MHDTTYMELFDRSMEQPAKSPEEQVQILRALGLTIPETAVEECSELLLQSEFVPLLEQLGTGDMDDGTSKWAPLYPARQFVLVPLSYFCAKLSL